jgi:hypothetical protein
MRARAEGMGGTFAALRPVDNGVRIIVRVPASPSSAAASGARPASATGEPTHD